MLVNKNVVRGLIAVAGLGCAAFSANAQAPASAQVWEIRFVVDNDGPFAQGPNATAVGITMQARVGIRANTSAAGTTNFGVSRVGGAASTAANAFLMTFVDALDTPGSSGSAGRGATGEALNDAGGNPLAGHFAAYRGSFAPANTGGNNSDPSNGQFGNNAAGNATARGLVGSRSAFNTNPGNIAPDAPGGALGAATVNADGSLTGDFTNVFRFVYTPRFQLGVTFPRDITVTAANIGVRYLSGNNGGGLFSASTAITLPAQTFTFRVPTPGAAALLGLGGLIAGRRRRA